MRRIYVVVLLSALAVLSVQVGVATQASAAVGNVVHVLHPTPSGNGRAVAHDPQTGRLFYTNSGDTHIYVIRSDGSWVATLSPTGPDGPIVYGALSWQSTSTGGVLWGGRFDGSGEVDRIDPATGTVTPAFQFPFPAGMSCYPQPPGYIDGLSYDYRDDNLLLGDDNSTEFYRVTTSGVVLDRYPVPSGRCRTGIAVDGPFLWLGLQSGPDTAPYDVVRVAKTDTTTPLQGLAFGSAAGPEGLAMDNTSFSGLCVLWSNQFGATTTLRAWQLPAGLCKTVPRPAPSPVPGRRSVGLLTFHLLQPNGQYVMELGQPEVRGCVATVVDSENLSTIVTAAHCLAGDASFGGNHTDLEFAPAHTGPCWDDPTHPSGAHQLLVSQCGNNPFGVWYASPSDIQIWPGYHPDTSSNAEDYAFITMHPAPGRSLVQNAVGGFRLVWDTATSVTGDRLQSQPWVTVSYASDDPSFTTSYTFGPMQCSWSGDATSTHLGSSASRIGVQLANGGICDSFGPPKLGQFQLQGGLPFGASGSPFVNQSNTADGSLAVGAILSGGGAYTVNGVFVPTLQGTKFGANAQDTLNLAQTVQP